MNQRKRNGLGKYDAPLKIQFQWGYNAFKRGRHSGNLNINTMQYREWLRGYNKAYFENLDKVKNHEKTRKRSKSLAK